jgi:putative Mg2+ transporter-C (MgtC) family protein
MPVTLSWEQVAVRIAAALVASFLIGLNRDESSRPAGLRTIMLVTMAATVAMVQANLLMHSVGKSSDSFVVLDLMRLPLGILSGIGFIGAGAIMKRENIVLGVTTAATLWFSTVIGLCFGGGQIGLGAAGTAVALIVLWGLKIFERMMPHRHAATLQLMLDADAPPLSELRRRMRSKDREIKSWAVRYDENGTPKMLTAEIEIELPGRAEPDTPPQIAKLAELEGVLEIFWKM